ncbi:MAG: hypothetical protein WCV79_02940 [Candidatus Paceibacterota bacterium]|jgi:hypothetical protein
MKAKLEHIQTRRDLNEFFDSVFQKTYQDLRERQKFEYEDTLPKSYIVEFNTGDKESQYGSDENKRELLLKTLSDSQEEFRIELSETKDPSLLYINSRLGEFFIDSLDPRFLFIHTLTKSEKSSRFVLGDLISNGHHFDSAWFIVQFLEKLSTKNNIVEGWDARFNPIPDISEIENPIYTRPRIAVSIDEPDSWEKYQRNKDIKFFNNLPLETLRVRRITDDNQIARARIQSNGKLTGRGTSFNEYLNIAVEVKDEYKKMVLGIEKEYSIKFSKSETISGFKFNGRPFSIQFSHKILKFDDFLNKMFSCTLPFRLLGTPKEVSKEYVKVNAIDLHIGSQISFEITPNFMRIYLPDKTCGNSVVRIIRSLQHEVDSNLIIDEI